MTPSANQPLTLIHFGDLHLWNIGWDGDPAFKRLLGLANLIVRRGRKFPYAVAQALIERLGGEQADLVMFTGDLTTTSLRREFSVARQLLQPLIEQWGERLIAIPGNHDRYTPRAHQGRLFETLFGNLPGELPLALDLNERWTLAAFDCAVPRPISSRGHLNPQAIARLDALLAEQRRRGRELIVAGHYPLVYPDRHKPGWEHVLPQREAVREVLQAHGVRVYLHGHAHHRWRLEDNGLIHLNCGSAGLNGSTPERRPGYLKLRLGPEGLESVEAHWLRPFSFRERLPEPQDWTVEELLPKSFSVFPPG